MICIDKFPYAPVGDKRLKNWNYLKEAQKMNKYIKDGDVIYDCGANIFDHSIFFALNNPKSTVIAFEPVFEYFKMGLKNKEHFNAQNIIGLNVALGEKNEEKIIYVDNEGSSIVFDGTNTREEKISIKPIDFLVDSKQIPGPNVIKIDVEGFALPLLKGAIKTLEKFKPVVIIELHPQFVGYKGAFEKLKTLSSIGINVIAQLNMGREFVAAFGQEKFNWRKFLAVDEITKIRCIYDNSSSKSELNQLAKRYAEIRNNNKVPISKKLIWSKLFRVITLKKAI